MYFHTFYEQLVLLVTCMQIVVCLLKCAQEMLCLLKLDFGENVCLNVLKRRVMYFCTFYERLVLLVTCMQIVVCLLKCAQEMLCLYKLDYGENVCINVLKRRFMIYNDVVETF